MYKKVSYLERMNPEVKKWIKENQDELSEEWDTYISELEDSGEHKRMLLRNDDCFLEFCEEIYYNKHKNK